MGLIELNADIGEGGDDARIIPHVQRVSIACGGHVGDAVSMRATLELAKKHGVLAGAHPSFPDPANFGRTSMHADPADIAGWVVGQTRALQAVADSMGMELFHVKPHGALYNQAAFDEQTAKGVIDAVLQLEGLALVALAGSPLVDWARRAGLRVLEEAFADRRYTLGGRLVARTVHGAVIEDAEQAIAQARAIAMGQPVRSAEGGLVHISADTLCLHGEGPQAAELARRLKARLG